MNPNPNNTPAPSEGMEIRTAAKAASEQLRLQTSNLTKAVVDVGPKIALTSDGLKALRNNFAGAVNDLASSTDKEAKKAAHANLTGNLLPKLDAIIAGLAGTAEHIDALAAQMPRGSTAATTGATATTDGGLGVEGVAGTLEDSSSGANTSTGTTPSDVSGNSSIVGNKPEDLAPGTSWAKAKPGGEEDKVADAPEAGNQSQ